MRPELINAGVLAYLGDSVLEVMVRDYLVRESELVKPNDFQKEAIKYVNTKGGKNESLEHMHSTGFEAIIGTLYLQKDYERLKIIFDRYKKYVNDK